MAIAVNATRLATLAPSNTSTTPHKLALGSTPTLGSTILVSMALIGDANNITGVFDEHGNTYTLIVDGGNHAVGARTLLYACKSQKGLVSGDAIYITTNGTFTSYAFAIDEVSGLGSLHAPDQTVTGFSTTAVASFSTGATAATAYTNELVWAVIATTTASGSTQTITAGTGYTQQGARVAPGTAISLYTEYKIVAATGAQTADGTINTTTAKYMATVATFPDAQSPESTRRAVSYAAASVSATVGINRGASFVGVEVAGSLTVAPPPSTKRRPSIIVA